ncbi:HesB/IscA family protein [Vulgatibacter sp.]|uniref:HesB/IscA family protein n=1 Tax=Vulgatibacter sp. TaxID=1971226 RepID=UPI0035660697
MENQDTGKLVGLGAKSTESRPEGQATTPAPGLTGLGSKGAAGGLTGLGARSAGGLGASGAGSSLTGLGSSGAAGGLTGLGGAAKPAAPAAAPAAAPRKAGIRIAESAAERIRKILTDRGTPDAGLRIRIRGGGCTGLQYDMEFADEAKEKDRVFSEHGVKIFVDPKSYIFLIGTELTYQQGLLESGFKLENPNVKKACGCGESFTI